MRIGLKKSKKADKNVLVLRTCGEDLRSYCGFQWPKKGPVECPDWDPQPVCGHGLHGLLWGCGEAALLDLEKPAWWLVVRVRASEIVDLGGKVKFPRGEVILATRERDAAVRYLLDHGAHDKPVAFRKAIAGKYGRATVGDFGQATAGEEGHAIAGKHGQATAGDFGRAIVGDYGQATAGEGGQATAGNYGQATAGDLGQAIAGDYGRATADNGGKATAGIGGIIAIQWWDMTAQRNRLAVGYPGENGIKPNTPYKLDHTGRFVEVEANEETGRQG